MLKNLCDSTLVYKQLHTNTGMTLKSISTLDPPVELRTHGATLEFEVLANDLGEGRRGAAEGVGHGMTHGCLTDRPVVACKRAGGGRSFVKVRYHLSYTNHFGLLHQQIKSFTV